MLGLLAVKYGVRILISFCFFGFLLLVRFFFGGGALNYFHFDDA